MDAAERERRRTEIGELVRRADETFGRGPLPSYLNVLTDLIIDLQVDNEKIHSQLAVLQGKVGGTKGWGSHGR